LDSTTSALEDARKAGKKLAADLDRADTASQLLQIIPSLGPFLDMANEIASVSGYLIFMFFILSSS
jgi:hypothetical protein